MKYLIKIYIFMLNLVYFFIKLFKTKKNRIYFLTRQSNNITLDFKLLIEELNKNNNIDIKTTTKRIEKKPYDFIIKNFFTNFKVMYYLATSKVVVIDGYNMLVSTLKHKKTLKVIQIWHSLAAIKKFGLAANKDERQDLIAKYMKMHANYDYIITGSNGMIEYFEKCFGYSKDCFVPLGLPRIDYILKKSKKEEILDKYKEFNNKKNIMYAPTFRDTDNYKIEELINAIDTDKYNLIFKAHDIMKCNIKNDKIFTCDDYSSIDLLSITDYLITDYSAISIEAKVLDIPVLLYTYDYDEYSIKPGINIDLKNELPCYDNPKDLYKDIDTNNVNDKLQKEFKKKYVCATDGKVTKRIAKFILERMTSNEKD